MSMITPDHDYRTILREELNIRCQQNPQYSLRAFARDIRLSPSRLSEVLNGKQGLSKVVASNVARALGYTADEAEIFCDLVESMHARSRVKRELAKIRLVKSKVHSNGSEAVAYESIKRDTFQMITDWYHFAILRLTQIKRPDNTPADATWFANALDISLTAAKSAIDRLLRLGLLEDRDGKLVARNTHESHSSTTPSAAIKDYHKQILERATIALYTQKIEERDFSAMTMPVSSAKLAAAREKIKNFRRELCEFLSGSETNDRVYCLSIQFFDLAPGLTRSRTEHSAALEN